jgi:hypothetical protein
MATEIKKISKATINAHIENLESQKASFEKVREARLKTIQKEIDMLQNDINRYQAELARRAEGPKTPEEEATAERNRERSLAYYHAKKEEANA